MKVATAREFRVLAVAPPDKVVPAEPIRQVGGELVGRLNSWTDLLGIGQDLLLDAVLWYSPPAEPERWIEGIMQLNRLRPSTGIVLVPSDRGRVGPMESEIIDRRRRGQLRNATAAADETAAVARGLRRVLADLGHAVDHGDSPADVRALRPWLAGSQPGQSTAPPQPLNATGKVTGHIITVLGPKGGVGKTTVSVGIACLAARRSPLQVVLVDLDGEAADVPVHLDMLDEPDIVDLLPHLEGGSQRLPTYGETLRVVPGPSRPDLASLVTPEAVERLLDLFARSFRYIIVDTGARLSDEAAWRAIDVADQLVLVLTPDAGSLRMARLLLDHSDRLGWGSKRLTVVLNQVYDRAPLDAGRIASFLGRSIEHRIPLDRSAVDGAILSGKPLVLHRPDHPISRALSGLCADLGVIPPDGVPETGVAALRERLRSWIRREDHRGRVDWPLTRGAGRR